MAVRFTVHGVERRGGTAPCVYVCVCRMCTVCRVYRVSCVSPRQSTATLNCTLANHSAPDEHCGYALTAVHMFVPHTVAVK